MFYKLARLFFKLDKPKLKLTSLAVAHIAHMRYIAIFIDPVKSCNLKCKMCYFSDDKKRPKPTTPIDINNIDKYKTLFKRAAKLQLDVVRSRRFINILQNLFKKERNTVFHTLKSQPTDNFLILTTYKSLSTPD